VFYFVLSVSQRRQVARFLGLEGQNKLSGWNIFVLLHDLKHNFLETTKFGEVQKNWGTAPECLPVVTGWDYVLRAVSQK